MTTRDEMFAAGMGLAEDFCRLNQIEMPTIRRLHKGERNYNLGTCAYYRPTTITIMVEKCANRGFGGRAWSWPGYAVDRTPYGALQHELGHHVDYLRSAAANATVSMIRHTQIRTGGAFAEYIRTISGEPKLTGYLGTDDRPETIHMEWFAENFRLFVTNAGLSKALRPRFYSAMIWAGIQPLTRDGWEIVLRRNGAPERIIDQARKKITKAETGGVRQILSPVLGHPAGH